MGAQFSCHRKEERLTNAMPTSKTAKEAIRREHYAIPTTGGVQAQLAGKTIFTVVDMRDDFWHVKLSEPLSYLCTLSTPWCRKRFFVCRLTFLRPARYCSNEMTIHLGILTCPRHSR